MFSFYRYLVIPSFSSILLSSLRRLYYFTFVFFVIISPAALADNFHVQGNHFVHNGQVVILQGTSVWDLEFGCNSGGHYQPNDFAAMKSWGMNAVRFNLNSSSWLNGASCSSNTTYQNQVKQAVANATAAGFFIILDLQWLAPNSGQNEQMAYSQDSSFWQQVAQTFGNNPNVGFTLVTEPHNVSWSQWYSGWNGGPGMKQLVSTVRSVAPNNIIFVNGLGWANDLSFLQNPAAYPGVIGPNIAYEEHVYDNVVGVQWNNNSGNVTCNCYLDSLMNNYAIVAGEFGVQNPQDFGIFPNTMRYFYAHQTGYFAWAWTNSADANGNYVYYLLNSYYGGSGSARSNNYGNIVYQFMTAHSTTGVTPPPSPAPTPSPSPTPSPAPMPTNSAVEIKGIGGMCLDVPGGNFYNGAHLQIWPCNGGANQKWSLNSSNSSISIYNSSGNPQWCIDIPDWNNARGTLVQLWQCNGGTNQQWSFTSKGGIQTKDGSGMYLDAPNPYSATTLPQGTSIQLWSYTGTNNQLWYATTR